MTVANALWRHKWASMFREIAIPLRNFLIRPHGVTDRQARGVPERCWWELWTVISWMVAQLIEKANWLMGLNKKAHTAAELITQPRGATLLGPDQRKLCTSYKRMNYAIVQCVIIICDKYSYCRWDFWYSALKTFYNERLQKMRNYAEMLVDPTSHRHPLVGTTQK